MTEDHNTVGEKMLLHSCCAPCSSYCLLYLSGQYRITVFYYNPNITEESEFRKRADEQQRLIGELNRFAVLSRSKEAGREADRILAGLPTKHAEQISWIRERLTEPRYEIYYIEGEYRGRRLLQMAKGLEKEPERGKRCLGCYGLRLSETKRTADELGFDCFATTLTLSPLKDAAAINRIGEELSGDGKAAYHASDFKKKNGYLLSILLSEVFGLYRQSFCGCSFSKKDADR